MQLLRRGDTGPAVVDVRRTLRDFGLLTPTQAGGQPDDEYDEAVEHAVRAFQQRRGLITDGIVGPATYRALREAGWTLGDRMLALMISAPMSGDDVVALQERLLELGYDTGRPGGVFDEQTERGAACFPTRLRPHPGRRVRAGDAARAAPARARSVTGGRPHLLREQELLRQAGSTAARQADRDRPGPRRS